MSTYQDFLSAHPDADAGALAYIASLEAVAAVAPDIAGTIVQELAESAE